MTRFSGITFGTEIEMAVEVEIDRPTAVALTVLTDYSNDERWRRGVRSMQSTPAGAVHVGTTTEEVMSLVGVTFRNSGIVDAVQPGYGFSWRTVRGADANGSRSVVPLTADSCLVRLTLRVRPHGSQRLAAHLLGWMLRRNLTGDAARLRALLELAAAGAPVRSRSAAPQR